MNPSINDLIQSAISKKCQVRFEYQGKTRFFAPHVLGYTETGALSVGGEQLAGESDSGLIPGKNWRVFAMTGITELTVLKKNFTVSALFNPAKTGIAHAAFAVTTT